MDAYKIQEDLLENIKDKVGDKGSWVDLIAEALSLDEKVRSKL